MISSTTAATTNAFAKALVEYLNYPTSATFYFDGRLVTNADINGKADRLVAQGIIIEYPGSPYTYALADGVN